MERPALPLDQLGMSAWMIWDCAECETTICESEGQYTGPVFSILGARVTGSAIIEDLTAPIPDDRACKCGSTTALVSTILTQEKAEI